MKATIFDIQRFSIHDGPGIRTAVFFKGCPLHCLWCHNPESKSARPQLRFLADKCRLCGLCASACKQGCHVIDGAHRVLRSACDGCGACVAVCPCGALQMAGEEKDTDEILAAVLRDAPFYRASAGGVTFTGGEPLLQYDALRALAAGCKKQNLHTALETSGFLPHPEDLAALAQWIDLFLFDCKETDPARHLAYTGADISVVRRSLCALSAAGARIVLRCPLIPGLNDREEHLIALARMAESTPGVEKIEIEPYHPLGRGKAAEFGLPYPLENLELTPDETAEKWLNILKNTTDMPVSRA